MIADVAHIQRQVAAEGVLHAETVIHHEGGLEIWIQRIERARRGCRARELALRKNNAIIPAESGWVERGLGQIDRAAKSLTANRGTRLSDWHDRIAGA